MKFLRILPPYRRILDARNELQKGKRDKKRKTRVNTEDKREKHVNKKPDFYRWAVDLDAACTDDGVCMGPLFNITSTDDLKLPLKPGLQYMRTIVADYSIIIIGIDVRHDINIVEHHA